MTQSTFTRTPETLAATFTQADGRYAFARWGRPVAPIVLGVEDETLTVFKGALQLVFGEAGHELAESDPEIGANLMVFFLRDWSELAEVAGLEVLIPELSALLPRLAQANARHYRLFRHDGEGAIRAAFLFIRMDEQLAQMPAEALALNEAVHAALIWGEGALNPAQVLATGQEGRFAIRAEIAALLKAAYDPVMPAVAGDASHALRLWARLPRG